MEAICDNFGGIEDLDGTSVSSLTTVPTSNTTIKIARAITMADNVSHYDDEVDVGTLGTDPSHDPGSVNADMFDLSSSSEELDADLNDGAEQAMQRAEAMRLQEEEVMEEARRRTEEARRRTEEAMQEAQQVKQAARKEQRKRNFQKWEQIEEHENAKKKPKRRDDDDEDKGGHSDVKPPPAAALPAASAAVSATK